MHPAVASYFSQPHPRHTCFVEGPADPQQRQLLAQRLSQMLSAGVPGYSVLVLLPDRAGREEYQDLLSRSELGPFGAVELNTYYSLAGRLVRLFWPLVAVEAGFASPQRPPVFLTYETAQYLMGVLIEPLLSQGYFEGLVLRRQQILSQLLDNLNKAAINAYPLSEVGQRLKGTWAGEELRLRYFDQAQQCAELFRGHCLQHGLLDLSLTVEVFHRHLVEKPQFWQYFAQRYRHLLVEQVEEMVPVAQDLAQRLLPLCDSALLSGDRRGGLRVFLGVDPSGVERLAGACGEVVRLPEEGGEDLRAFVWAVGRALEVEVGEPPAGQGHGAVLGLIEERHRAAMIAKAAQGVGRLVQEGVAPGQIAIVAPHADGVLRFALAEALKAAQVPFAMVRRYESLREEPAVRACLTLARLAHLDWGPPPPAFDVAEALGVALAPLDPLRAALLVHLGYGEEVGEFRPAALLEPGESARLGEGVLARFEGLRRWLEGYRAQGAPEAIDQFLRRLFAEVLSLAQVQPDEAALYSKLIASATWFRQVGPALGLGSRALGQGYAQMVRSGVVAAQYLAGLDVEAAPDSIALVAPVHTYLLSGHQARYQFWLDIGSPRWWEPPQQLLTNPHILSRAWDPSRRWTLEADEGARNTVLYRLVRGLALRCREGIFLCASELESGGQLQESPLLEAVQQVLQEGVP
ncbi:MAG: hypothetical protein FJY95_22655 [Candidatus Handelsmanbacteria bacterium]|nr:hypothetical protein [Candidatus Handelsmanbacteria bacterium]